MAAIRIVDTWLRSPASPPSQWRSVMVVAEKWAEQRVLMRAYAESRDQMLPTITLFGMELAIGPAGIDSNGPWGVHVGAPDERRAHEIKTHLEAAARRLAGSKGNPPRLLDEEPTFEREPTGNWSPGAPRLLPRRHDGQLPSVEHVAPVGAARVRPEGASYVALHPQVAHQAAETGSVVAPTNPELRKTPLPRPRSRTRQPMPASSQAVPPNKGTALGYTSGAGAQSAIVRLGLAPAISARLGWLVDRVVPPEFHLDAAERRVLNALGERELSARAIGQMLDVGDPVAFMEELLAKLETYNLHLVEPGDPSGGEPTYRLRA